jgi:pimeloyl-ACP methyl ester carboxylesterase
MNISELPREKPPTALARAVERRRVRNSNLQKSRGFWGSVIAASSGDSPVSESVHTQSALLAVLAACGSLAAAACLGQELNAVAIARPTPAIWDDWMQEIRESRDALEWSDCRVAEDWRLQQHAGDIRWRLLNPRDEVIVEGPRADCETTFVQLQAAGTIPTVSGPTVLVLHGLGQGRQSMQPLVSHLRKTLDANVLSVGYASPRAGLEVHADMLNEVIDQLPEATTLSFVGHSLGNLVVRRWMANAPAQTLQRVQRMVMLGPPNQGSELARLASRVWFLAVLSDGPTRQLGADWKEVVNKLAVPPCDFGIVAGGTGDDRGMSMLLPGDDDAIVTVDETRLDGAAGFLLLPVHHAAMMRDKAVQEAAVCFLRNGRFPGPVLADSIEDSPPAAGTRNDPRDPISTEVTGDGG